MVPSAETVVVRANSAQTFALAAMGGAIAVLFCTVAWGAWGTPPPLIELAAIAASIFMVVFVAARALFLLAAHSPLLTIEPTGISIEPAIFGDEVIPWANLRNIRYRRVYYGLGPLPFAPRHWLSFTVVDAQRFRTRLNLIQRMLAYVWYAEYMFRGSVGINSGLSSIPIPRVYSVMAARKEGQRSQ